MVVLLCIIQPQSSMKGGTLKNCKTPPLPTTLTLQGFQPKLQIFSTTYIKNTSIWPLYHCKDTHIKPWRGMVTKALNMQLHNNFNAHERGYSYTRHCQNFSSDTRHWGQNYPPPDIQYLPQHSDTQLHKDVIQERKDRVIIPSRCSTLCFSSRHLAL